MAKRTKNTKTYRVRVVNPAPPPGHRARTITTTAPRRNPELTARETLVLKRLRKRAQESGDDWGIIMWVDEYLGDPEDDWTVDEFLHKLKTQTGVNYHDVGDREDRASYERAYGYVEDAIHEIERGGTLKNPQYRYAAVPVTEDGAETAYVVRGRRRADMVRNVAREVPGDAMVDLQRTRTFGTKHEAQAYGSATSPRVRALSRRISGGGS